MKKISLIILITFLILPMVGCSSIMEKREACIKEFIADHKECKRALYMTYGFYKGLAFNKRFIERCYRGKWNNQTLANFTKLYHEMGKHQTTRRLGRSLK